MTDTQIKDYLKKYRIDSEESLAKHIEELKRNTIPNNEIIFPLVDLLLNEKSVLNSFFAENKIRVNFYKDDVITVKDRFKDLQEVINYFLDSDFDTYFAYKEGQLIAQDFKKATKTVTPFFLDEMLGKCSTQCFCDGSCKKPQEKKLGGYNKPTIKGNSTRHKSQAGEAHKEIVGDLEGINRPPSIYNLYDKQNCYTSKALETLNNQSAERHNIMNSDENIKKHSIHLEEKDDVIINSNRGEKETMEYLQGVKESQSVDKAPIFTYCKVNKNALEALSLRALYGHIKYKETDQDWQNFTRVPNALEEYANASFRHALGIGEEDEETHLVAEAWNAVAKLEVFLRNKLNKS